jgi:hypothetical protein
MSRIIKPSVTDRSFSSQRYVLLSYGPFDGRLDIRHAYVFDIDKTQASRSISLPPAPGPIMLDPDAIGAAEHVLS